MDVVLSVLIALFFWFCFWLCMASFFLSVLFWIAFLFALCCFHLSSAFDCSLSLCIRSGIWPAKSAAALRCRLFPKPIDHWFDIGLTAVWNGDGPAWRNRTNELEELPISDGPEHGSFLRKANSFWNHGGRSPTYLVFLNRYRGQLVHFRYRIRWVMFSDIGVLWSASYRWTI